MGSPGGSASKCGRSSRKWLTCAAQRGPSRNVVFDRVLMVCTGNICRSPMAQVLLEQALRKRGFDVRVESAGLGALVGRGADPMAMQLMEKRGLDLKTHRAR